MSFTEAEHYDRVWAEVDLDAALYNMERMHQNLKSGITWMKCIGWLIPIQS